MIKVKPTTKETRPRLNVRERGILLRLFYHGLKNGEAFKLIEDLAKDKEDTFEVLIDEEKAGVPMAPGKYKITVLHRDLPQTNIEEFRKLRKKVLGQGEPGRPKTIRKRGKPKTK